MTLLSTLIMTLISSFIVTLISSFIVTLLSSLIHPMLSKFRNPPLGFWYSLQVNPEGHGLMVRVRIRGRVIRLGSRGLSLSSSGVPGPT